jgi:Zn-finger nucleic acid-binding protein
MCKYCEKEEWLNNGILDEIAYIDEYTPNRFLLEVYESPTTSEPVQSIEIDYCPKCGGRLSAAK